MNITHLRQATLFLAGAALLCTACTHTAAATGSANPHKRVYPPEREQDKAARIKLLADIQQAARDCSSMEWYASVESFHAAGKSWHESYPISGEDAAVIRDLLLHKLHLVKFGDSGADIYPADPLAYKRLRFLDAGGKVIYEFEFEGFGMHIGKDSDTDANGYQYCRCLSMPDADYETWQKLHPAKMNEDLAKWSKGACKK